MEPVTINLEAKEPNLRTLRSGTSYFFDTNFLLLPQSLLPKLKHGRIEPLWITETTRQELIDKLGLSSVKQITHGRYKILRFNDLYREDPGICPVYYYYVLSMYNPANIGSEDFGEQLYRSRVIRGEEIGEKERRQYEKMRRCSPVGHALDPSGKPKDAFFRHLEDLRRRVTNKAKRAFQDKHPAYMRDIKNLALILYYALSKRRNVTYYTTDGDPIPLFFTWLDSMSMWLTLNVSVLSGLGDEGRRSVMRGETREILLDYLDFVERRGKMFRRFVSNRWKEAGLRFAVRHWDQNERRFSKDIHVVFTDEMAEELSSAHGNLSCHFTKNDTYGNWLELHYHPYWRPSKPEETQVRVVVNKKSIINRSSRWVAPEEHDKNCSYREEDRTGEMSSWSAFV